MMKWEGKKAALCPSKVIVSDFKGEQRKGLGTVLEKKGF